MFLADLVGRIKVELIEEKSGYLRPAPSRNMLLRRGNVIKVVKVQSNLLRQTPVRLAVVLGLTLLYCMTIQTITDKVGLGGAALVAIPVAAVGWSFGVSAGLAAGFAGIVLTAMFLVHTTGLPFLTQIVDYWPGNAMVITIGYIAGRLQRELSERTHALEELRARERLLRLINITTKDILDPKGPDDRDYYLVSHLINIFTADYAHLIHWDPSQERAILVTTTLPQGRPIAHVVLNSSESKLTSSVLQSGHALALDDASSSKHAVNPASIQKLASPLQSALCIPLIARDYKLGMAIVAFNAPRHFTAEEVEYAELAGNQIALALRSAQQELQIQKQLRETYALGNISRVLSETEKVGIETVLQLIVDAARELIPSAEQAVLHLIDNEQQILIPRAVTGFASEAKTKLDMHLGEGIAGQVIATGQVIGVSDTQTDPRFLNRTTPVQFRSLVVAPIQTNECCVGTISVQSNQPNAFTSNEFRSLGALGTQAAIAIENANLLETTKQDLKEINALYHVSQGLTGSLDPDELLKDVVELLQKNFDCYHVQAFTVDTDHNALMARYGSGKIGNSLSEQGYQLPIGMGLVGHVAETGEPFMTNDVDQSVFFVHHPLLPETQSSLTVPLKVDDQVVAVLDIQQARPRRFTPRDMQLVSSVADQLAVALHKANLYAELQTSLRQERQTRAQLIQAERLAVMGRLLASVSHELNNPLQAIQNALFLVKDEEKLSAQGRNDLEIVLSETERMADMISRLRAFYRPIRMEDFQDIQLNDIAVDVAALTANHMRHKKITYEFIPDLEMPMIPGIADQIRQVVLNLFMNAVQAMQAGGHLTVHTHHLPKQDRILLAITDTGPGIGPEILPQIFEPFVTNKENGTGLGLTITADIIHKHHGEILAENNPNGGATFKVWLPKKRQEQK